MGQFKVEVVAVGGHGCQREHRDGDLVHGCQHRGCPDCAARAFVAELLRLGCNVEKAELSHWPGTPSQVTDDLLSQKRTGSF